MLETAVYHLLHNVMPAAADYEAAEKALTITYGADPAPANWEVPARRKLFSAIKRRATSARSTSNHNITLV
jgi:hypothetical protein